MRPNVNKSSNDNLRKVITISPMNTVVFKPELVVSGRKLSLAGLGWTGAKVVKV